MPLPSTWSGSVTRWTKFFGGLGRSEGTKAFLRGRKVWEPTAGGRSCGRFCYWSEPQGRKDAAESGWKSGKHKWKSGQFVQKYLNENHFGLTEVLLGSWPHKRWLWTVGRGWRTGSNLVKKTTTTRYHKWHNHWKHYAVKITRCAFMLLYLVYIASARFEPFVSPELL